MHQARLKSSCKRANRSSNAADRLSQIKYVKSDATLIDQIDYTYDAAGQRISKTMLNGSSAPETPMTATFDAGNRMQTITLNPGKPEQKIYNLTYDNNGNLTKKQLSTDTSCTTDCTEYVWDSRNRLTQIKQNQTTTASLSYDAENRRIQTNITSNGATNQVSYIYSGSQSVGEVRNQQLSHSLMTGLQMDEHIARIALNQGATPQVKTYLTDALGSVIATAKADQSLEVGYAFSPYGQTQKVGVENQLAGSENSSQYTGRENDNNGLYFYRARYYDPVLKRFISEDPIGLADGHNVYGYVGGNPISRIDPTGKWLIVLAPAVIVGSGLYLMKQCMEKCMKDPFCPDDVKSRSSYGSCAGYCFTLSNLWMTVMDIGFAPSTPRPYPFPAGTERYPNFRTGKLKIISQLARSIYETHPPTDIYSGI